MFVGFTTIAVRPETKRRLERLRRARGFRSMDELALAAVHELEMQEDAAEIRRHARGWQEARRDPATEAFVEAMDGLPGTIKDARGRMRRRNARRPRP